ncbi:MAG: GDSL-type esterase/lipase family protein [Myxococcota bacterium]|nr:GDSL-type esterase/lipase family protein [Myxococcota bacterium]
MIHVAPGDEQDRDVLFTNYGLFVLHQLGGGRLPIVDCSGHGWNLLSNPECAWLFGWADFLQAAMQGDRILEDSAFPGGPPLFQIDIEPPLPPVDGRGQDGAVAASLWDLLDAEPEPSDGVQFPLADIFGVVAAHLPTDVCDFRKTFRNIHDREGLADPVYVAHGIDDCGGIDYAALGDSYSSGEGVPPYSVETDQDGTSGEFRNLCHRSPFAYSAFARVPGAEKSIEDLSQESEDFSREFIACSGAVVDNVRTGGAPPANAVKQVEGGGTFVSEVAQLDQVLAGDPTMSTVGPQTDLVTITIGGNDAAFLVIAATCVAAPDCQEFPVRLFQGDLRPLKELFPILVSERVKPAVRAVYSQIRTRAPNATIVALGYPPLFGGHRVCADAVPFGNVGISVQEQEFIRSITGILNGALEEAAAEAGIHFAPYESTTGVSSDLWFSGHELCGIFEPPFFNGLLAKGAAKAHPNVFGHRAWGEFLNAFLSERSLESWPHGFFETGLPRNPPPSVAALVSAAPRAPEEELPPIFLRELAVVDASSVPCESTEAFAPGQSVRVSGAGFSAESEVILGFVSGSDGFTAVLESASSSALGELVSVVTIPGDAPAPSAGMILASGTTPDGDFLVLLGETNLGESFAADGDEDGVPDLCDNCPETTPAGQLDSDADGQGDVCDPCPDDFADDADGDGLCADVDPCPVDTENDVDGDGVCADADNCPLDPNPDQEDADGDGRGDACQDTPCFALDLSVRPLGGGTVSGADGNCRLVDYQEGSSLDLVATPVPGYHFTGWVGDRTSTMNALETVVDSDLDLVANFCTSSDDADGDLVADACDNCVLVANPRQRDANAAEDDDASVAGVQHYGDACDADLNEDGLVAPDDFFGHLRPCLGATAPFVGTCGEADFDGDGIVGPSDFFSVFRPSIGQPPGPGATEPGP